MQATDFGFLGLNGKVWLTLLTLFALGFFSFVIYKRWLIIKQAKSTERFNRWSERLKNLFLYFFGQKGLFFRKERFSGLVHAVIFWGFCIFLVRSLSLFIEGFTSWEIPNNLIGNFYFFWKDLFAVLVSVSILIAMFRRWVLKVKRLTLSWDANLILLQILALMVTDLLIDGAIYATMGTNPRGAWAPFSGFTMMLLQGLSPGALTAIHHISWWLHIFVLLFFLNYLPLSKHFHVITSFFNVLFTNPDETRIVMSKLDVEGAFERNESLGLQTIKDLNWKDVFDLYSCTECGRCTDNCPAHLSGKILSPKEIILELRDHAEHEIPAFGKPTETRDIVGISVQPEEIWACTSCMACVEACPIQIDQLSKILEMRRNEVMIKDKYPPTFQSVFKGMDGRGNPWDMPSNERLAWMKGLNVKTMAEQNGDASQIEYLFFVGCAASFDPRTQKIARAVVQILNAAGVKFAVLGEEEGCTGDPARRIGHEYIFQMLAQQNIETFNNYHVKKIITICPHCFNTFKNEYPQFGGNYEVIHHTVLIEHLVKSGKIQFKKPIHATIAFHDSCYLGRYNRIFDAPRVVLQKIPGVNLVEMDRNRERGMCCGAGGGLMWVEEEPGKRVNELRITQAQEAFSRAKTDGMSHVIANACPFCMIMMEDGIKAKNVDFQDRDISELVVESMDVTEPKQAVAQGGAN
ncbi:(Fe-S)-binding protein [Candidatus Acetothermia bacterium]|nr:(Fe-S)-binding protein [Candidatus Acetothermia bacterium]